MKIYDLSKAAITLQSTEGKRFRFVLRNVEIELNSEVEDRAIPGSMRSVSRSKEHSQSYVNGKIQNIGQLCAAEERATGAQKAAIDSEIRNEAFTIREAQLPADEGIYRL